MPVTKPVETADNDARPLHERHWVVLTGLLGSALGIVAVLVDVLSSVPAWIVWGSLGGVAVVLVSVAAARAILRVRRAIHEVQRQRDEIVRSRAAIERYVDMNMLADIIFAARHRGWIVRRRDEHKVHFISPDGKDVEVRFVLGPVDAPRVARELHEASPEHFPKGWAPHEISVDLVDRIEALESRIEAIQAHDAKPSANPDPSRMQSREPGAELRPTRTSRRAP